MKSFHKLLKVILTAVAGAITLAPAPLLACAACTGKTDSSLAVAMNWGIVTLLGFVLCVLTCVVVFFVHVARRTTPDDDEATQQHTTSMNLPLVGTSRCDVPVREAAGGKVAPLNATRTAQRAVPAVENIGKPVL